MLYPMLCQKSSSREVAEAEVVKQLLPEVRKWP